MLVAFAVLAAGCGVSRVEAAPRVASSGTTAVISSILYERGAQAFYQGETEDARQLLLRAFGLGATGVDVLYLLGLCDSSLGQLARAVEWFSAGLSAGDYRRAELLEGRGLALLELGREDDALLDLTASLELDPYSYPACRSRGRLLLERGDYEGAVRDLTAAYGWIGDPWLFVERAQAYLALGKPALAIADCTRAIKDRPRFPWAHLVRARAHLVVGDWTAAALDASTCIEQEEDRPSDYVDQAEAILRRTAKELADRQL